MNRLFWKIFLSFWFSLVLFATATMLVASLYLESTRAHREAENPRDRYRTYLEAARAAAEYEGLEGLKDWSRKLDRSEAIPHLLIDTSGNDLMGRPVSPHLAERLKNRSRLPGHSKRRRNLWRRGVIKVPVGSEYRLIPDFQGVTLGRVLSRPRVIAIPILVAAVISGFVCFLLARYLTTPIRRLSRVTRQFANGELDKRVTPSMGGRRDEIADLARDFDRMAEHLQGLIGSQKQLLRDVSHELRSPLTRLQVALGLARQREAHNDNPELDRIEREAEHLNQLIGQLLSLARLESGAMLSHTLTVNLEDLLAEIVDNAEYEANARNRHVRILEYLPAKVEVNEALVRSALENVVRNAVHYTQEGSTVDISLLQDHERPDWVEICVSDHGPGVPDDMLAKLFDPFIRVGDARDRDSGGYVLGLAIAERAIGLHGGEVSAINGSNGGLKVFIRLPVAQL